MAEAFEFTSILLHCDAEGCGHEEPIPAMDAAYIGKPCPKCGANLLTKEDFDSAKMLEAAAGLFNAIVGPIEPSGNAIPVSINPHAGDWNIRVKGARH